MNGNLKKMREKRNEIIAAMEAVVNAAAAEERSLTDDEITAYNGHRDELTRIDATIAAIENVRSARKNAPAAGAVRSDRQAAWCRSPWKHTC